MHVIHTTGRKSDAAATATITESPIIWESPTMEAMRTRKNAHNSMIFGKAGVRTFFRTA